MTLVRRLFLLSVSCFAAWIPVHDAQARASGDEASPAVQSAADLSTPSSVSQTSFASLLSGAGESAQTSASKPVLQTIAPGMTSAASNLPMFAGGSNADEEQAAHKPKAASAQTAIKGDVLLSVQHFSKLASLRPWHLRAVAALKNHTEQSRLTLHDFIFSDANADGKLEVVAQVRGKLKDEKPFLSVLVFTVSDDGKLNLRYEYRQEQAEGRLSQRLLPLARGMGICESWDVATWVVHECNDVLLDGAWNAYTLRQTIETRESNTHTAQAQHFDFQTRRVQRTYRRLPVGTFMPALQRQSDSAMLFGTYAPNAGAYPASPPPDVVQFLVNDTPKEASDYHPIHLAARWNKDGLELSFWLEDFTPTPAASCSESMAVQRLDHVEVWFDLNPSPSIQRNAPESWQLEYEKAYQVNPYRHDIDADIFGLAITANGCLVYMTPSRQHWRAVPAYQVSPTPYGYHIQLFLSSAFFGVSDMTKLPRTHGIGFSAVQHDVHDADAVTFNTYATSAWRWPDPFSFGQLWLLPDGAKALPRFPVRWETWLLDN